MRDGAEWNDSNRGLRRGRKSHAHSSLMDFQSITPEIVLCARKGARLALMISISTFAINFEEVQPFKGLLNAKSTSSLSLSPHQIEHFQARTSPTSKWLILANCFAENFPSYRGDFHAYKCGILKTFKLANEAFRQEDAGWSESSKAHRELKSSTPHHHVSCSRHSIIYYSISLMLFRSMFYPICITDRKTAIEVKFHLESIWLEQTLASSLFIAFGFISFKRTDHHPRLPLSFFSTPLFFATFKYRKNFFIIPWMHNEVSWREKKDFFFLFRDKQNLVRF